MNNAKTEFITFGSRSSLHKQLELEMMLQKAQKTIRFLGITLDKELDRKKFIAAKPRTAYFNIKKSRRLEIT